MCGMQIQDAPRLLEGQLLEKEKMQQVMGLVI